MSGWGGGAVVFSPLVCSTRSPARAPERLSRSPSRAGSALPPPSSPSRKSQPASPSAVSLNHAAAPSRARRPGVLLRPAAIAALSPSSYVLELQRIIVTFTSRWKQRLCSCLTEINSFFPLFYRVLNTPHSGQSSFHPSITPLRV